MAGDVTRLQPIQDAEWPAEVVDLLPGFAGQLNVYRTMAHHPALLRAWAPLREHVVRSNALGPENLEIVILRAAFRIGSDYEWGHHVSRARALNMSDERISAVRDGGQGDDGVLVRAVDALFEDRKLTAALEQEITSRFGRHAALDTMATVGFYSVLGFILKTFETPVDAEIVEELRHRSLV